MAYDKAKRNAAIKRYQDKAQKRFTLFFHTEKDKNIIDFIEQEQKKGQTPTQTIKKLFENSKNKAWHYGHHMI